AIMKTLSHLPLAAVALLGLLSTARVHADPPLWPTGKVLLLDNQRVLEGDIQKQGDQYVIRRGICEMTVPAGQAMRLYASWDDAYAFMQSQANLRDPDERLRLASWCEMNGLRGQALAEAARAVEMRPNHTASRQLLAKLQK